MNVHPLEQQKWIKKRGAALILTLSVLTLITVLVVGFSDLVRIEKISSTTYFDRFHAQNFSQLAVNRVIGTLRQETADLVVPMKEENGTSVPIKNPKSWATRPGALIVASRRDQTSLSKEIPLHSGMPSDAEMQVPEIFRPTSLNIQTLRDQQPPTRLITDEKALDLTEHELNLKWVYVRKNGQLDLDVEPDVTQVDNPLVGRFAYWVDDESSKINLNTSWKRTVHAASDANPFPSAHPTSIHLGVIPGMTDAMVDALHQSITPGGKYEDMIGNGGNRFFNSIYEFRKLGPSFHQVINDSKFQLTHYSHDPNTTFFNKPRIVLTTLDEYAPRDHQGEILLDYDDYGDQGGPRPYFLDIYKSTRKSLATPTDDRMWYPGRDVDPVKLNKTINMLNRYLERTDWPMLPANAQSSFQKKYYENRKHRLTQLSLNIINYVRCKESKGDQNPASKLKGTVTPIRGTYQTSTNQFILAVNDTPTSSDAFFGLTRTPKITEMSFWLRDDLKEAKFLLEIHIPENIGLDSVDVTGIGLYAHSDYVGAFEWNIASNEYEIKNPGEAPTKTNPVLKAGGYALITRTRPLTGKTSRPSNNRVDLRFAISNPNTSAGLQRWDLAPYSHNNRVFFTLDPPGTAVENVGSMEVDDPVVNSHRDDWVRAPKNSFLEVNHASSLGKPPGNHSPEQDTDASGLVTDVGFRIPSIPGSPSNPRGVIESAGELGHIHTGMESDGKGIPFRTLRLQPSRLSNTVVPDWAFMDLFTAPVVMPEQAKSIFAPHGSSFGGRINLNSRPAPFGDLPDQKALLRYLPLEAVLYQAPVNQAGKRITKSEARVLAGNLYHHRLATQGKHFGYAKAYDSPGEIVEVKGIADGGEESEELVRQVANLFTTRGSVFTIYTIGQALQQKRSGGISVVGESRQQTMLERYLYQSNTPDGGLKESVKFRLISTRQLSP